MSSAVIIIVIIVIILLVALGIGLYFAFRKKSSSPTNSSPPENSGDTGATGPPELPILPGPITPAPPVGSSGPTGTCGNAFSAVLAATTTPGSTFPRQALFNRSRMAAIVPAGACPIGDLSLWILSNALVYNYITQANPNATPTELLNNYNEIFIVPYPNGISNNVQDYNNSLWAIRAIPTDPVQTTEFGSFWNQGIPPGLVPTPGSKPGMYPQTF